MIPCSGTSLGTTELTGFDRMQYLGMMTSEYNFQHTAASAPGIYSERVLVNDAFAQPADLREEAQRFFMPWMEGACDQTKGL